MIILVIKKCEGKEYWLPRGEKVNPNFILLCTKVQKNTPPTLHNGNYPTIRL